MESPAESRTTTNRKERGRELGSKRRFYILGVMIVIAVLLFISGTANRNSYGKAGLTGDEPPAVWRMSYFYGKINAASGQKGLLAEHGIHGSRLQIKDGGSAGNKTVEREKKGSTVREKAKKDADHRDDTGENSRLDGKNAERKKMKFKRVALTFDDGPHPEHTEKILKLLKKYNAKATFFMLGSNVEKYPAIAAKIAKEGHELGNHTWNHFDLTARDDEKITEEIAETNRIIEKATGQKPTVFRPPYGAMNEQVETAVKMMPVMWTVDTLDWKASAPQEIIEMVRNNAEDGSIILMHDIHEVTVEALAVILEYLDGEGFDFVTVSELEKY